MAELPPRPRAGAPPRRRGVRPGRRGLVLVLIVVTAAGRGRSGWSRVVAGLGLLRSWSAALVGGRPGRCVVRLDALGYEVRLVRGAGVKRGRWADVDEASTAEVGGSRSSWLCATDGPRRCRSGAGGRPRRVRRDPGPPRLLRRLDPALIRYRRTSACSLSGFGEASPSPVYGARLLSGLRINLSRVQIPPPPQRVGPPVISSEEPRGPAQPCALALQGSAMQLYEPTVG